MQRQGIGRLRGAVPQTKVDQAGNRLIYHAHYRNEPWPARRYNHDSCGLSRAAFCARSCSTICLLQLPHETQSAYFLSFTRNQVRNVLSARVETSRLGHLVPELPLGAQFPHKRCDAEDDEAKGGSVGLPVGRLGVPTTSRRPNVLGVAREGIRSGFRIIWMRHRCAALFAVSR